MKIVLDYELARVRSLKGDLLSPAVYERLIEARLPEEIIGVFSETPYHDDVMAALLESPGYAGIEKGLRNNLARCFTSLASFFSEEAKPLIRVILGRYDLANLKAILRGKHIGAPTKEIFEAVMPAGELTDVLLARLAEQPDVRGVVNLLSSWFSPYAPVLREALAEYTRTSHLVDLELPLDMFFYREAFAELGQLKNDLNALLLKEFLQQDIDCVNIVTALRLSSEKLSAEHARPYFIPGGRKFSLAQYEQVLAITSPEQLVEVLANTPYRTAAEEGLKRYANTGLVSAFQRAIEEFEVRAANKLFLADPLTIALTIAYVWTKYNEVTNLRIIVRGRASGMEESAIREALIVV